MIQNSNLTKKSAIIVPSFNEEEGIEDFLLSLQTEIESISHHYNISFTIIVVDDGSRDNTVSKLLSIIHEKKLSISSQIKIIRLIRNFGHQAAIITGLVEAATFANFAITLDADGEHPVLLLSKLIEEWLKGHNIVHTKRMPSIELPLAKRLSSKIYYMLISLVSTVKIESGMADFKLWDGDVLRQIQNFLPECGSTRVFASWLAPDGPIVNYHQNFKADRISRFSFNKMLKLALGGLFRFSDWPLRLALFFGIGMTIISFILALHAIISYTTGKTVSGWTSLVVIICFFGGLNSFLIGLLSEYLLRFSFRSKFPLAIKGRISSMVSR